MRYLAQLLEFTDANGLPERWVPQTSYGSHPSVATALAVGIHSLAPIAADCIVDCADGGPAKESLVITYMPAGTVVASICLAEKFKVDIIALADE